MCGRNSHHQENCLVKGNTKDIKPWGLTADLLKIQGPEEETGRIQKVDPLEAGGQGRRHWETASREHQPLGSTPDADKPSTNHTEASLTPRWHSGFLKTKKPSSAGTWKGTWHALKILLQETGSVGVRRWETGSGPAWKAWK